MGITKTEIVTAVIINELNYNEVDPERMARRILKALERWNGEDKTKQRVQAKQQTLGGH